MFKFPCDFHGCRISITILFLIWAFMYLIAFYIQNVAHLYAKSSNILDRNAIFVFVKRMQYQHRRSELFSSLEVMNWFLGKLDHECIMTPLGAWGILIYNINCYEIWNYKKVPIMAGILMAETDVLVRNNVGFSILPKDNWYKMAK